MEIVGNLRLLHRFRLWIAVVLEGAWNAGMQKQREDFAVLPIEYTDNVVVVINEDIV